MTVATKTQGKESPYAPAPGASGADAPGATSSSRSLHAPAPGADAPYFVHFGELSVINYYLLEIVIMIAHLRNPSLRQIPQRCFSYADVFQILPLGR